MNHRCRKTWALVLSASILATGCQPQQPFYCQEDGDLSHYLDVATEIEYPDVHEPSLDEVNNALGSAHAQEHRQLRDVGSVARRDGPHHALQ